MGILIERITTERTPELEANAVTIIVSGERFTKIGRKPEFPFGAYGVLVGGPEVADEDLVAAAQAAMLPTILAAYDQLLNNVLTPNQYRRALAANKAGKIIKFAKAPTKK